MTTTEQLITEIIKQLDQHQRWSEAVKPLAIVCVLGESNGTAILPFYTPHLGWQNLSHSIAPIALFLIQGEDWQSTDPDRTVDEMLLAIQRTGRDTLLIGKGEPIPEKVCEMADRLKLTIHSENYAWN